MTALALLKALTVHRPWSDLIASGHKLVENRSWSTGYRGLLLIHGGAAWSHDAELIARDLGHPCPHRGESPGGHVAVVHLHDVHYKGVGCGEDCVDYGRPQQYHWMVRLLLKLPTTVPERGQQGLWTPSMTVQAQVRAWLDNAAWSVR